MVTHDSFIVDCQEIDSASNAASYLSKYFTKDWHFETRRKMLGFSRSWSRSRNWPVSNLQLRITKEGEEDKKYGVLAPKRGWRKVTYLGRHGVAGHIWARGDLAWWIDHSPDHHPLMERVGTDLAKELSTKSRLKAQQLRLNTAKGLIGL